MGLTIWELWALDSVAQTLVAGKQELSIGQCPIASSDSLRLLRALVGVMNFPEKKMKF